MSWKIASAMKKGRRYWRPFSIKMLCLGERSERVCACFGRIDVLGAGYGDRNIDAGRCRCSLCRGPPVDANAACVFQPVDESVFCDEVDCQIFFRDCQVICCDVAEARRAGPCLELRCERRMGFGVFGSTGDVGLFAGPECLRFEG